MNRATATHLQPPAATASAAAAARAQEEGRRSSRAAARRSHACRRRACARAARARARADRAARARARRARRASAGTDCECVCIWAVTLPTLSPQSRLLAAQAGVFLFSYVLAYLAENDPLARPAGTTPAYVRQKHCRPRIVRVSVRACGFTLGRQAAISFISRFDDAQFITRQGGRESHAHDGVGRLFKRGCATSLPGGSRRFDRHRGPLQRVELLRVVS